MGGTEILALPRYDEQAASLAFGFLLRSGRAVIVPAYKGTLERGPSVFYQDAGQPNRGRDVWIQWSKDLGRSIDYLETRPDINSGSLAFIGTDVGAVNTPRLVAIERRIKAAI